MGTYISKTGTEMGRGTSKATNRAETGSSDGVFTTGEKKEITTTWKQVGRNRKGFIKQGVYKDEILKATTDGEGNVTFDYASGEFEGSYDDGEREKRVTFRLQAGAINGETFNIDWSKVKTVSGRTYPIGAEARKAGLKWNGERKRWERP